MAKHPFHQLHVYRKNAKCQRPVTDCYRLLYCKEIWQMTSEAMTKQASNQMPSTLIEDFISRLKEGAYSWINHPGSPYNFQKTEIDILQQAVVIVLQSVYVDVLTNSGKQQALSAAITRIRRLFIDKTWCITGEIDFSKINSQTIFKITAARIKDHRFLKLIQQLFKHNIANKEVSQNDLYRLLVAIGMAELAKQLQRKLGDHYHMDTVICKNNITIGIYGSKKQALLTKDCLQETTRQDMLFQFTDEPNLQHLEKPIAYFDYCFKKIPIQRHEIERFAWQKRQIQFYIPKQQLQKIARDLQYGDYMGFKSARRRILMNHSEYDMVKVYNQEMKKLAAYYIHADNRYCLMKLRALAQSSFLKTVSAKRKTTPKKIARLLVRPGYVGIWIACKDKRNKTHWMPFLSSQQLAVLIKNAP